MKLAQCLVVVASEVSGGRRTPLAVVAAAAGVGVVAGAGPPADTQEDHSCLMRCACRATHCRWARPAKWSNQSSGYLFQLKGKILHTTYIYVNFNLLAISLTD